MARPPSPLVGFNNNVKHKGRIFHVQTEDSGVNRPHIITHLFADGGRIVKSTRTDYSEHVGRADMGVVVRRLMKEQHKAMFIALRDGQLDEAVERICGPLSSGEASPADEAPVSLPPSTASMGPVSSPEPAAPHPTTLAGLSPTEVRPAPTEEVLVPRRPAPTLTDLVLADLEAARARGAPAVEVAHKPQPKGATPLLGTPAASAARSPSGRYAAPRPAAIFSQTSGENSIFGGSSISEQSLDEVILSYLAEDLDGSTEE